jgi:hypothetical protein
MANKQDFIVKHGITVLSTDTSTGTTTGAIITPGGAGIGGSVNIGGDIRVQGVNLLNYDDHVIYVSDGTGNDTTGDGRRVQSAFATIKHALSQATSGDVVYVEAGTYTENSGNSVCTLCPAGTYSTTIGASSITACIPCAAGTISSAGSTDNVVMSTLSC